MKEQIDQKTGIVPAGEQGLALPDYRPPFDTNVVEPDEVIRYRVRRRRRLVRFLWALVKIVIAVAVAWLFYLIPGSSSNPIYNWKNPVITFLLICFIGKTLLDTFFYDHYQP